MWERIFFNVFAVFVNLLRSLVFVRRASVYDLCMMTGVLVCVFFVALRRKVIVLFLLTWFRGHDIIMDISRFQFCSG